MRCYWCDCDRFQAVNSNGEYKEISEMVNIGETPKDYVCTWCGHLASEPNPRGGDPEETIESVKEELGDVRAQLEQCLAERTVDE